MKKFIFIKKLLIYFIFISFLHPRGFYEYSLIYKNFFTNCLYLSVVISFIIILLDLRNSKFHLKKYILYMLIYHLLMLIITLVNKGGITAGLQKIFATPALCLICTYYLKNDQKLFFKCISNLLLIILGLNVLVFNPFLFNSYFRDEIHLMFIGHVQLGSQLGLLGIFISYLLSYINGKWKLKNSFLVIFSVATMILSNTSCSLISLVIFLISILYIKFSKKCKFLKLNSKVYLSMYLLINFILFFILIKNNWVFPFNFMSFNGRTFIWRNAFELINLHKLFGYGVHGVLIQVFWSKWIGGGMNYAHNQLVQVMLDGGIVLLIVFILMMKYYTKPLNNLNSKIVPFVNCCLGVMYFIMCVESPMEEFYIFFFISIIGNISEIIKKVEIEEKKI